MENNTKLSKCCGYPQIVHEGGEGTSYWACGKCGGEFIEEHVKDTLNTGKDLTCFSHPIPWKKDFESKFLNRISKGNFSNDPLLTLQIIEFISSTLQSQLEDVEQALPGETKGNIGGHGIGRNEYRAEVLAIIHKLKKQ